MQVDRKVATAERYINPVRFPTAATRRRPVYARIYTVYSIIINPDRKTLFRLEGTRVRVLHRQYSVLYLPLLIFLNVISARGRQPFYHRGPIIVVFLPLKRQYKLPVPTWMSMKRCEMRNHKYHLHYYKSYILIRRHGVKYGFQKQCIMMLRNLVTRMS